MASRKNSAGSKTAQKVVIPKGMINPGETTIIEIPSNLQKQPIVVAKRKTSLESVNYVRRRDKEKKQLATCCKGVSSKEKSRCPQGSRGCNSRGSNSPDLDITERKERDQFLRDLEDFQRARRKLLSNASFLAGESGVPAKFAN